MKTVSEFPRRVREIENAWIPLADGCRLAARIWLPEDAEQNPVPAILEYLPYRKRDGTAERDELDAPLLRRPRLRLRAGRHARQRRLRRPAARRVPEQEQDDALEVIAWLAAQPWCTGSGRHDRHLLGRLQRAAGRRAPAARAEGDHHRSARPTTATPTTSTTWAAAC